ncbi:glycosyltransferase [Vibrio astriarenae]|nr:glycosyltransferase [Vibrio sp. C7]
MNILYIVHDLNDAAVHRRVAMLEAGGANITLMGFFRGKEPNLSSSTISLGQTHDASFLHRVLSISKAKLMLKQCLATHQIGRNNHDLIIARNLDMLALGVAANKKLDLPLVYECLDIHRFLIHSGVLGRLFRQLEQSLTRSASMLITSSQGFVDHYFRPISKASLPTLVLENKVFTTKPLPTVEPQASVNGPIIITWNGAIRCSRSLDILCDVSNKMAGRVKVVIRGKPAYTEFNDFQAIIDSHAHIEFLGPYQFPDDLAQIYSSAHFNWTLDYFEEGGNSEWLLPNRIYEGGLFSTPPLYRRGNFTAQTLEALQIGCPLKGLTNQEITDEVVDFLSRLNQGNYQQLVQASLSVPTSRWLFDTAQAKSLVATLQQLSLPSQSQNLTELTSC